MADRRKLWYRGRRILYRGTRDLYFIDLLIAGQIREQPIGRFSVSLFQCFKLFQVFHAVSCCFMLFHMFHAVSWCFMVFQRVSLKGKSMKQFREFTLIIQMEAINK